MTNSAGDQTELLGQPTPDGNPPEEETRVPGQADVGPAESEVPQPHSGFRPLIIEIIQTVLLTLVIFLAVRSVVQNFKVDGSSMEPTLHTGQYLLINKLTYFHLEGLPLQIARDVGLYRGDSASIFPFGGPQRGDIIVFRYPGGPDRDFIKRVIGLPGDQVQIDHGRVYVNGVLQHEDYIRAVPSYSVPPERVPEGQYFVLGDNRPNSSDSHIWGFVPEANIIGKAWVSYWPPNDWGVLAHNGIAGSQ